MSGTSLDGLDVALCKISEAGRQTKVQLESFTTLAYPEEVKDRIRAVFAQETVDFQLLTLLNPWIGNYHGELVMQALETWEITPASIDVIASHGQTVYHMPRRLHHRPDYGDGTLQIGDGDHLAMRTGIITISDFRQKHIAAGGEGAPLAMYGDCLLFSHPQEHRILLNMGGIANFTWLPAGGNFDGVFVTDTGPGNTMLDAAVRQFFPGKAFDEDGRLAASGRIHAGLLAALQEDPFFKASIPKTTGPEQFNLHYLAKAQQQTGTTDLSATDILATLARFSAETIAGCIKRELPLWQDARLYASGGGAHNPVLMRHLRELLPGITFSTTGELNIDGDAKEAVLFAVLANETLAGGNLHFGSLPAVSMGKISFPG